MPGVVFLIVVPTANFERELIYGKNHEVLPPLVPVNQIVTTAAGSGALITTTAAAATTTIATATHAALGNNNLNINLPEHNNAILRLEVELRDKHAAKDGRGAAAAGGGGRVRGRGGGSGATAGRAIAAPIVPLEKVLEELLVKLEIEHVTWTTSKKDYFHQVVFPLQSGEPCETTLHCLTELGIGIKLNSSVSVLPCSVSYDALTDAAGNDNGEDGAAGNEDLSKWNNFVESIKSKLTVKQVVDGVRAGGSLSFDYLLLIVTADSLAALGLVENNATNITAAMLVSPLMGPVMSITFGAIIADRELMRVGFITLAVGMFLSCLFGFIFGLILGTTEMPWGSGDWPTEEMRARGNARSLWMGVLWALTSGTGVAVALLQGSAGPLIGVAISASLLPPVVNCGLFWALACIWLIYPEKRIPHLKGESYNETSAYPFLYTDYLPTEFLVNGIVSCLLTVVNVICIFITAIIILKIKEVSAPYTASPDLKRFWETDLRTVRQSNRQSIRHRRQTMREKLIPQELAEHNPELDNVLQQAFKEAEDDVTFKKVKRMSYSSNAAGELTQRLAKWTGLTKHDSADFGNNSTGTLAAGSHAGSRMNSMRQSKLHVDLHLLDKLVNNLLEQKTANDQHNANIGENSRRSSFKLSRWHPTSRSAHTFNYAEGVHMQEHGNMPTIMESSSGGYSNQNTPAATEQPPPAWTASLERTPAAMRNVLNRIASVPQRLSQNLGGSGNKEEENLNLTENFR